MYISYQIEIQCMRYASCTITWMFKYIPYPDLLTDLSEKYIRLVVHILVLIHRVRVSDSGTNYSKFSQEAVKPSPNKPHINARMARKCKNSPNSKKNAKTENYKQIKLIHGQGKICSHFSEYSWFRLFARIEW